MNKENALDKLNQIFRIQHDQDGPFPMATTGWDSCTNNVIPNRKFFSFYDYYYFENGEEVIEGYQQPGSAEPDSNPEEEFTCLDQNLDRLIEEGQDVFKEYHGLKDKKAVFEKQQKMKDDFTKDLFDKIKLIKK